jgi:short-subunit dehydrogenase
MSKWAMVTGATAGIGESFTRVLARDGFNIVLVARDLERMKERAAHLESTFKIQSAIVQADLATDSGCATVEKYIAENQIEVLINNAGFGINKAFSMSDLESEQQLLDVLVRTPMRLMHTIIPQMKARNSGSIINVSSVAGWIAGGTYSASKSYLTVLSESLYTEMSGTGIKISALCPGFTRTEFHERGRMRMKGLPEFMWLSSDRVASEAWKDNQRGKVLSVPGWQYLILSTISRFGPRPLVRKLGMNVRTRQRQK